MAQVTRKDRDRRGGHKTAGLPSVFDGDGIVHYTPVERNFLKRNGRKAMRKQHAKAVAMALNEAIEDSHLDAVEQAEFDSFYDNYEQHFAEEPLDSGQDWWAYEDDYDYPYDPYPTPEDMLFDDLFDTGY